MIPFLFYRFLFLYYNALLLSVHSKLYKNPSDLYISHRIFPNFTHSLPFFTPLIFLPFFCAILNMQKQKPVYLSFIRGNFMLSVKNLEKSYTTGKQTYPVLKGISFSIAKGEFVAVMGPSGSGKSTLLNCISCYIPFEKGKITLGGQELSSMTPEQLAIVRNEKLGFVFQDFMLLDGLTVRENILVPRIIRSNVDKDGERYADQLMELFGISHIRSKYPAEISGGERQRTAVARSLINRPLMILADEPTGNLDSRSSRIVIESFENARNNLDATIFMVTHDSFSASFCDRVILLKDGMVYRQLEKNIQTRSAFHDTLLNAIKEMSGDAE